jgi:hypothetical protein
MIDINLSIEEHALLEIKWMFSIRMPLFIYKLLQHPREVMVSNGCGKIAKSTRIVAEFYNISVSMKCVHEKNLWCLIASEIEVSDRGALEAPTSATSHSSSSDGVSCSSIFSISSPLSSESS